MYKKVLILCLSLFTLQTSLTAKEKHKEISLEIPQQKTRAISGTITDQNNEPLVGATITVKGLNSHGTISDIDGQFLLNIEPNSTLVISSLGYVSKEIKIGNEKSLSVVLQENEFLLNEVTVTALGISREKKSLGYAIGEVKGDELDKAKETNIVNSLAGKIPGLIISQTAGGPSGSTRVLIRGNTELTGNNEPLYIVDGVPLDNTNFGSADTWGGFDLGNGVSNINPDDIESMSILKGPAAAALYGSRASHGVVLITTKKAGGKKKLGIEFNSTITAERQLTKFDVQSMYGQGGSGRITGDDDIYSSSSSWGPKIDDGLFIIYFDGVKRPYEFVENNINGFFQTGVTTTNTLVLNSVQEKSGVRLSYTNMHNRDIVPNTNMSRNSINIRANTQFIEKLDLDVKANYVREDVKNRPALSGSGTNVGTNLMTLATTFDQAWLKNSYINDRGEYYDWNNNNIYNLNPYWVLYAMQNSSVKDRFSGSGSLSYKINDKMNVRLTTGGEVNIFDFMDYAPVSTPGTPLGYMNKNSFKNYVYNAELIFSYKEKIGLFDVGVNAGANVFHVNNHTSLIKATDMKIRDKVALQNFLTKETSEAAYQKQINSLFAMFNWGYKDFLFLDATIRGDKSSTLPSNNNTYVYPSVSSSLLFSELLKIEKRVFSYGKLRASFAQVGSDTDPYMTQLTYRMPDKPYYNYAQTTINNNVVPNKDLKPTRTNSAEFGLDLKFLNNRISLDMTYYIQNSKDQILRLPISNSSGYDEKMVNAGNIENKGVEIALGTRLVDAKDLSWDLNFNFAKNSNKVKALASGLDRFTIAQARWLDVTVDAVVGENYGSIMGRDFQRNEQGDILVNGDTGLPLISDEISVLGNATWDWTGGINSSVRYKGVTLSAVIDIKVGADLYSMTSRSLHQTGKAQVTLNGRDGWYESEEKRLEAGVTQADWLPTGGYLVGGVIEGIDQNGNKTYTKNERFVDPEKYWSHVAQNVPVTFITDNSYVKIREITVSYQFPKRWIRKFAEDISVSFVSRNPFIIYKNIDNIDPDSNYNNSWAMGLEFGSLPSRRSYGVNLQVKF